MKRQSLFFLLIFMAALTMSSCMEHYSDGERVGYVTQFSKTGVVFKTWEGHLNTTQTGMNSATPFDFSIEDDSVAKQVIEAAKTGSLVELKYHETAGFANLWNHRGETNHFVTQVVVKDSTRNEPIRQ